MTQLDSSILAGVGQTNPLASYESGQKSAEDFMSNSIKIREQRQDMTDQKKLSGIMRTLDPSSNTYAQDLFTAASHAGVGAKELLQLKQNVYTQQGLDLERQAKQVQISSMVNKMTDDQFEQWQKRMDTLNGSLGSVVSSYDSATPEQKKDPEFLGGLQTQRNLEYQAQADAHRGFTIDKLVANGTLPASIKNSDEQDQNQILGQLAQKGNAEARDYLRDSQKWTQLKSTPFSVDMVRDQYNSSNTAKEAAAVRLKNAQEKAALENKLVPVQVPDREHPGEYITEWRPASEASGERVGSRAPGAGGGADMDQRARSIQDEFALNGVKLPAGVTPYGKDKAQFWQDLAKNPEYKDLSPHEIAMKARGGALEITAATKETQQAAGRVAQVAGTTAAIFAPKNDANPEGGIAPQLEDAAHEVGLSDLKIGTMSKDALSKLYSSPEWARYKEVHGEFVTEMGVVLSKAAPTVHGAEEAARMFPLVSSQGELHAQVVQAKKVALQVERGNQAVLEAIRNGDPLSKVLEAADIKKPANKAPAGKTQSGATTSGW